MTNFGNFRTLQKRLIHEKAQKRKRIKQRKKIHLNYYVFDNLTARFTAFVQLFANRATKLFTAPDSRNRP